MKYILTLFHILLIASLHSQPPINGDKVLGDKVSGDKVLGDKITINNFNALSEEKMRALMQEALKSDRQSEKQSELYFRTLKSISELVHCSNKTNHPKSVNEFVSKRNTFNKEIYQELLLDKESSAIIPVIDKINFYLNMLAYSSDVMNFKIKQEDFSNEIIRFMRPKLKYPENYDYFNIPQSIVCTIKKQDRDSLIKLRNKYLDFSSDFLASWNSRLFVNNQLIDLNLVPEAEWLKLDSIKDKLIEYNSIFRDALNSLHEKSLTEKRMQLSVPDDKLILICLTENAVLDPFELNSTSKIFEIIGGYNDMLDLLFNDLISIMRKQNEILKPK